MMKCLMLRSRDNARTPMQWDGSVKKQAFTDGEPWIKINPNCKEINAASQLDDPDSNFPLLSEADRASQGERDYRVRRV